MKKYVLLSVLVFGFLSLISLANAVSPTPTTILSENFGTGSSTFSTSPWSNGGNSGEDAEFRAPSSGNDSASPDGGRFAVMLGTNGYICRTINATGYENLKISYNWRGDSNANPGDYGIVEYKPGAGDCSGTFTNLKTHNLENHSSWSTQSSFDLPANLSNTSFKIKFRVNSNQNNEDFRVDNIVITGVDPVAPTLNLPSNITQEAISSSGNVVNFTATSTDINPTNPVVTCTPSSGSTFPIGINNVNCSATDTAGNTANGSFTIKIQDTTAPIISLNGSSPVKVQVFGTYTELGAIASDLVDGNLSAIVSGDTVDTSVLGTYTVKYNKTDANGNIATEVTRTVNVVDESAPSTTDNVPSLWQNTNTTITFSCTDNVDCLKVYYTMDGTNPTTSSSFVDVSSNWQFTISIDGEYSIKYFGIDGSGNEESIKTASNTLKLDKTTPTASVSSPTENLHLKGFVTIEANTTDSLSGISKVEFWHATADTKIGEDTEAPYSITWDTTNVSDGNHSVWVVAYDNAGNHKVSEKIPVVVDNTKPVITLQDEIEINIYIGMEYPFEILKFTAIDNIDGDITNEVITTNDIDNTKIGSYKLYYNVTDNSGNKADEVTRTVNVVSRRRTQTTTTETTTTENTGTNTEEAPENTNPQGEVLGEETTGNTTENTNTVITEEKPVGEVLGEETFKFTKFMKIGSRNEEVSELQKRLTQEGVYTGPITGYFGKLTDKAVREYQAKNPPLKVDGIVGPKTRAVLNGEI